MGLMDSDPGHPSDYDLMTRYASKQPRISEEELVTVVLPIINTFMNEAVVVMRQLVVELVTEMGEQMHKELWASIMESQAQHPPAGYHKLRLLTNSELPLSLSALGLARHSKEERKEEGREGVYFVKEEERREERKEEKTDDSVKEMLGAILSRLSEIESKNGGEESTKEADVSTKESDVPIVEQPLYKYTWGKYNPMAYQRSVSELGNFS